ncbi:MAG: SRPBCC family protein [Bacteroidetes bacterium]|nr:SRPBCC family protein [Bacteroidota bacterium]MBK9541209.1 SRPBCC family protein [Bacteroidota bacterium]MBP6402290.1 SRPBCC family protein [Bacteroidia bacterium]MBP6648413.1 SRPBCC family protein [Bacteroidia bacterium]
MKIFKRILFIIAILLLLIAGIGLLLPSQVHVERSIDINKDQNSLFSFVSNYDNWNQWSPWYELDTATLYTFEGPHSGKGAILKWKSDNKNVGQGSMTITDLVAPELIKQDLNFMDEGISKSEYRFKPAATGTTVTWALDMEMGFNPLFRIIGKFMDGMVGKDFEKGLLKLKTITEAMPAESGSELKVEEVKIPSSHYLSVHDTATVATIGMTLGKNYGVIGEAMKKQNLEMAGSPFAFYFSESSVNFDLAAAIPVNKPGKADGNVQAGEIKAGNALLVRFFGPYELTAKAHTAIHEYIGAHNKKIIGAPWEVYVTDPGLEKDTAKWETDVYYPVE